MRELIYNQRQIPKEKWRYGFRSSAATGCGWIATYNALHLMGYHAEPEDLIEYYQRQFPLVHGNTGTSVWGPEVCFKQWGFPVTFETRRSCFDSAAEQADVCILFYHWRKDWKLGAHFITVKKTPEGYVGYNVYRTSTGPESLGDSLEGFLKRKKFFGAALIAIKDKRSAD